MPDKRYDFSARDSVSLRDKLQLLSEEKRDMLRPHFDEVYTVLDGDSSDSSDSGPRSFRDEYQSCMDRQAASLKIIFDTFQVCTTFFTPSHAAT